MDQVSTPIQTPPVKGRNSTKILIFVILLLLVAILLAIGTYWYFQNSRIDKSKNQKESSSLQATPIVSNPSIKPSPTFYPTNNNPNLSRFISDKLGITFTYLENVEEEQVVKTLEQGNKVYVYFDKTKTESGQWIEAFNKDPGISLEEAITKTFLTNYSATDCYVKKYDRPGFDSAIITFPESSTDQDNPWANAEKCPQTYTSTNGLSYFIEDKTSPSRFFYLSIGQYAIRSENNKSWQDTLQILK